jgi:hypothetical protein
MQMNALELQVKELTAAIEQRVACHQDLIQRWTPFQASIA